MFVTWGTGVYCVKNVAFFNLGFDFLMVWCIHSMVYTAKSFGTAKNNLKQAVKVLQFGSRHDPLGHSMIITFSAI